LELLIRLDCQSRAKRKAGRGELICTGLFRRDWRTSALAFLLPRASSSHLRRAPFRPYKIKPKSLWIGELSATGYAEADFHDAARRYVTQSDLNALVAEWKADERPKTDPTPKAA
jgi:hypothetical protein